jgi:hypothetical protein
VIPPYGAAIVDAIRRGELRQMKAVLTQAQRLYKVQGDLGKGIARLETAIAKLEKTKAKRAKR